MFSLSLSQSLVLSVCLQDTWLSVTVAPAQTGEGAFMWGKGSLQETSGGGSQLPLRSLERSV